MSARSSPSPPPTRRRRRRRQLEVRGDVAVPRGLLPWERDLLLPLVLRVLAEVLPGTGKEGAP